jgi:hypothetical protein
VSRTTTWTRLSCCPCVPLLGSIGGHGDHVLAASAVNIPQHGDLDLLARRHDRGIDDPQFPVDVGAAYPEPRGGLVGKGDLGAFLGRALVGVAYF